MSIDNFSKQYVVPVPASGGPYNVIDLITYGLALQSPYPGIAGGNGVAIITNFLAGFPIYTLTVDPTQITNLNGITISNNAAVVGAGNNTAALTVSNATGAGNDLIDLKNTHGTVSVDQNGNFSTFGGLTAATFAGNGGSLTGLQTANLSGAVAFTNGGFGQSLGTNWVPVGAQYDTGTLTGSDPAYGITLKAGVEYQVNPNGDANFQGLTDDTESAIYAGVGGGTFTASSNGVYAVVSSTPSVAVLVKVYAVSNMFLPVSPNFGDTTANSLTLNTPLPTGSGGTGASDPSSFPALFGTKYNFDTANYPWDSSWTPSYPGQVIIQNIGGETQPTAVYVATGMALRMGTNLIWIPFGITGAGSPGHMAPNVGNNIEFFINGNPIDQTNTQAGDHFMRVFNMNTYQSGTFYVAPHISTNSALTRSGEPFPNNYSSAQTTNAAGNIIYLLDGEALSIGVVSVDCTNQSDLPGTCLWVNNGGAVYGGNNFALAPVIALNGAINGLTAGNYSMLRVDPNHGWIGTQWVLDKAWNPTSNNWAWAWRCNYVTNEFQVSSNLDVGGVLNVTNAGSFRTNLTAGGTFTVTNGFACLATNTFAVTTTGTTNTGTICMKLLGVVGTTVVYSNQISGVHVSLGTITVPQQFTLEPHECLSAASGFACATNVAGP